MANVSITVSVKKTFWFYVLLAILKMKLKWGLKYIKNKRVLCMHINGKPPKKSQYITVKDVLTNEPWKQV